MKCGKLMWGVWFIASFAAFHKGLEAFGWNLLTTKLFTTTLAVTVKPIMLLMGVCGLISMMTLFMGGCKECKPQ